jgi:branched-chain amino acid transport system ATP-binding protein
MMADAKLVLLDEPGAGVNPTLLKEIAAAIRRLNRERGYTFCIIEHNMDLIAELCDPVIVMAEGRVLTQGTIAAVRADRTVVEAYLGGAAGAAA